MYTLTAVICQEDFWHSKALNYNRSIKINLIYWFTVWAGLFNYFAVCSVVHFTWSLFYCSPYKNENCSITSWDRQYCALYYPLILLIDTSANSTVKWMAINLFSLVTLLQRLPTSYLFKESSDFSLLYNIPMFGVIKTMEKNYRVKTKQKAVGRFALLLKYCSVSSWIALCQSANFCTLVCGYIVRHFVIMYWQEVIRLLLTVTFNCYHKWTGIKTFFFFCGGGGYLY